MALEETFALVIVFLAALTALAGIFVLERFFRNRIKELFDDRQYFIFFCLILGYLLYALGEVSFYLMKLLTNSYPQSGISDVYWVSGSALILISFFSLSLSLYKNSGKSNLIHLLIGIILLAFITSILLSLNQNSFLRYYYPLVSTLIFSFSLSIFFNYQKIENFHPPLIIFSLASLGILLGDIFFSYILNRNLGQGIIYTLGDIFYCLGYGLSFLAFLVLYWKIHQESKE